LRRRTVIGLGANLGDRLASMQTATRYIHRIAAVEAMSRVYASAPVGGPPQGEFLNAAVLLRYSGEPAELLGALLAIERALGRVRSERWGPRTIDLDVLWVEGLAVEAQSLTVPHRHLRERAFAVAPLLDVAPDARDPRTGEGYAIPPGDLRVTTYSLLEQKV
jgi:2-amino-4-hydroxy-6-hydroxymethyldihydropteridine diphosphokinase